VKPQKKIRHMSNFEPDEEEEEATNKDKENVSPKKKCFTKGKKKKQTGEFLLRTGNWKTTTEECATECKLKH